MKIWIPGLMLLVAAGAQAAALSSVSVQRQPIYGGYHSEGVVQALRSAALAVPVAGRITRLPAAVGQHVNAGQLLAQVDDAGAQETAQASRAQIAAAQAQLLEAKKQYARAKVLAAKQYLSAAALDRAEARLAGAEAQANAQIASAHAAGAQAGLFRLSAPFAGLVARVNGDLGAVTMPGQPIVELYDPAALRVEVELPISVYAKVRQNIAPAVRLGDGAVQAVQKIEWFPSTDPKSQTRTVRLILPAGARAVPGQLAGVDFVLADRHTALTVPRRSVLHQREYDAVYVLDSRQQPQLRYVRLGGAQGDRVEVESGLAAGDRVALDPEAAARASGGQP